MVCAIRQNPGRSTCRRRGGLIDSPLAPAQTTVHVAARAVETSASSAMTLQLRRADTALPWTVYINGTIVTVLPADSAQLSLKRTTLGGSHPDTFKKRTLSWSTFAFNFEWLWNERASMITSAAPC